jgi:hypothetical protein
MRREQALNLGAQRSIVRAGTVEEGDALCLGTSGHRMEQFFDLLPTLGSHRNSDERVMSNQGKK